MKWMGNLIKNKDGSIILNGRGGLAYSVVSLNPDSKYKIKFKAKRTSGNGILFLNFYGNRHTDFKQESVQLKKEEKDYEITLETRRLYSSVPMKLRFWRNDKGSGNVEISNITCELIEEPKPIVKEQEIIETTVPPAPEKPKVKQEKKIEQVNKKEEKRIHQKQEQRKQQLIKKQLKKNKFKKRKQRQRSLGLNYKNTYVLGFCKKYGVHP